jgi:hypothetical protein
MRARCGNSRLRRTSAPARTADSVRRARFRIRTRITEQGSQVDRGLYIDKRARQTGARRWEQRHDVTRPMFDKPLAGTS